MSISEYLDTFVGLAFTYLILSLIVTVIFESIVQFTRLRARNLQRAIRKMLEEQDSSSIVNAFYEHPLVKSLRKEKKVEPHNSGKLEDEKRNGESGSKSKAGDKESFAKRSWEVVRSTPERSWEVVRSKPGFSYIEPSTFALVAMNTLFPEESLGNKNMDHIANLVKDLPKSKIRTVLLTHLRAGVKNLEELRKGVETWFNDTMDRLSGWFTRTARWISLVIGLVVAIGLNVDTFVVANAFWREPSLRANVANYAAENYKKYSPKQDTVKVSVDSLKAELASLELPIGWDTYGPPDSLSKKGSWEVARVWAPQHIIGWLFTAFAVSLGAHFWFDILSRIVKLRAAGKPPTVKPKKEKEQE
jgi:ABC-type multidrug transport system fused ATPase/permease subunit